MRLLIDKLKSEGVLKTRNIERALKKNDRKEFIPENLQDQAYADAPLPIGGGQTISQPYTVVFMLELLKPEKGQKVLDVGFGSGWTTALLAEIVGEQGKVFGMEIVPELFDWGRENITKFDYHNIKLYNKSGWDGLPEELPFDRILVSAAPEEVPQAMRDQLAVGGRMVIPVGGNAMLGQTMKLLKKVSDKNFEEEEYPGFAFVPLVK